MFSSPVTYAYLNILTHHLYFSQRFVTKMLHSHLPPHRGIHKRFPHLRGGKRLPTMRIKNGQGEGWGFAVSGNPLKSSLCNGTSRLRGYISQKRTKLLLNTVAISNFQCCPLIWLFCSKAADNLINRTTKCAMRIIYTKDNEKTLDALLQRDGTLTIHKKNLRKLIVEIYKTINHLNPPYMWGLFTKKVVEYNFRIHILYKLPPARSQRFGTNLLKFEGSLLWNSLSDEIKTAKSLALFNQEIKSWNGSQCTCNICRT